MRPLLALPALVLAAITALGPVPVTAATGAVMFTDPAGDANAINGQGEKGFGSIDAPTGEASIKEADVRRVKLRPTYAAGGVTRNGFKVVVTTTGTPKGGAQYWLDGKVEGRCDRVLVYHHPGSVTHAARTTISFNCGDGSDLHVADLAPARLKGTTLVIRVPNAALPDWVRPRHRLSRIWIEARQGIGLANVLDTATTRSSFPLR